MSLGGRASQRKRGRSFNMNSELDHESIKPDKELDCRGETCPMPVLKTKKALKTMKPGQILHMVGTDKGTKEDLPALCERTGHELLKIVDREDGCTSYYIRRGKDKR
jgi:tRNA 2-thiouridine synthesizing protein A